MSWPSHDLSQGLYLSSQRIWGLPGLVKMWQRVRWCKMDTSSPLSSLIYLLKSYQTWYHLWHSVIIVILHECHGGELWTLWQQIDPGCCSLDWYLCRQWSFWAFFFSPLCCASWSERELWVEGGQIWGKMSHQESQRGVKPCMGKRGSVASFCPLCALGKMI